MGNKSPAFTLFSPFLDLLPRPQPLPQILYRDIVPLLMVQGVTGIVSSLLLTSFIISPTHVHELTDWAGLKNCVLDICWCSRQSFYEVNGRIGGLHFFRKYFEIFFWSGSRPGISSTLFSGSTRFAASSSSSSLQLIIFLAWKPLHMVHMTLKNTFLRSDSPCEVLFRSKSLIPTENLNLKLLQTRLSLKTRLSLLLDLTMSKQMILN